MAGTPWSGRLNWAAVKRIEHDLNCTTPALARGDLDLVVTSDPIDLPGVEYFAFVSVRGEISR